MRDIILCKAITNIPATAGAENLTSNFDIVLSLKGLCSVFTDIFPFTLKNPRKEHAGFLTYKYYSNFRSKSY